MLWTVQVLFKAFFCGNSNWKKIGKKWKIMEIYGILLMFMSDTAGKLAGLTDLGGMRYDGKRV